MSYMETSTTGSLLTVSWARNGSGAADSSPAALAAELATTRFVVQRILMPIVIAFGVVGNVLNIAVLTRRSMKSSTNHYLSALAVYDVLYLALVFVITLQQHHGTAASSPLYVRLRPHVTWLGNTCSNTGVWLTVTFTVERYIGVCHPMRGKVWCTPRRARFVIVVVCLAAAVITFPEVFEFQVEAHRNENGNDLRGRQMSSDNNRDRPAILRAAVLN